MTQDVEQDAGPSAEPSESGHATGKQGTRPEQKGFLSRAARLLSPESALIGVVIGGFIALFVHMSNLSQAQTERLDEFQNRVIELTIGLERHREERMETVRQEIAADLEALDSRLRAIEVGHSNLEGQLEGAQVIDGPTAGPQ